MTGSRKRWEEKLNSGAQKPISEAPFAEGRGVSYPLLGERPAGALTAAQPSVQAWQVRLTWANSLASLAQGTHLLEDLDQIEFPTLVEERELNSFDLPEIYLPGTGETAGGSQEVVRVTPWEKESDLHGLSLRSRRQVRADGRIQWEKAVSCGLNLLGNIAVIQEALRTAPEARWTLTLPPSPEDHPEDLIRATLMALSGILAGVSTLEVRQGEEESLEALTWRLGLLRLLRWEADLGSISDPCCGAGFFSELRERLRP